MDQIILPVPEPRQFDVTRLQVASYFLALGYLMLAVMASFQLRKINKFVLRWNALKVFNFMLVFHVYVRTLTWMSLCFMSLLHYDSANAYGLQVVLFTIPEYLMMSTYTILFFQWCEFYVFSHEQFIYLSKRKFSFTWKACFGGISLLLYGFLLTFYLLLFIQPEEVQDSFSYVIQYTEVFANFGLPFLFTCARIYLQFFSLSGFPFKTTASEERVEKISRVFTLWTCGRIIRGSVLLLSIQHQWLQVLSETYYSMFTVTVLILSEVVPIVLMLDWTIIQALLIGNDSIEAPEERTPLVAQGIGSIDSNTPSQEAATSPCSAIAGWQIDMKALKLNAPIFDDGLNSIQTGKCRGRSVCVRGFCLQKIERSQLQELSVDLVSYSAIDSPYFVTFFGVAQLVKDASVTLYQVSEWMERGNLFELLRSIPSALSAFNIIRMAREMTAAIQHLHSLSLVHGHLTSKVMMLDGHMRIKVAEAGLSRLIAFCEVMYDRRSHDAWTAPEVFQGSARSMAGDVYSLGVIFWEMITRQEPFAGEKNLKKVVCAGGGLPLPASSALPSAFFQLVTSCLELDPFRRKTVNQVGEELSRMQYLLDDT